MVRCGSVRRSFEPSIVWLILTLIGGSRQDPDCMFCERITTKLGRFSSDPVYIYIYISWKSTTILKMVVNLLEDDKLTPTKNKGEARKPTGRKKWWLDPRTSVSNQLGDPQLVAAKTCLFEGGGILLRCSKIVNIPSLKLTACT